MGIDNKSGYDVFRDSNYRYLGYANEIGEALRPLIPRSIVNLSYGVAISYVLADVYHKAVKTYNRPIFGGSKHAAITAGDVFLWQMFASVIIPGFTINRITWATGKVLDTMKTKGNYIRFIPTAVGLLSIPFIVKPIDKLVDVGMDETYRKAL